MHQHSPQKVSYPVQLVLEIGYDAELPAATPKGPEQIGILLLAGD
jgi:hypothetical protein